MRKNSYCGVTFLVVALAIAAVSGWARTVTGANKPVAASPLTLPSLCLVREFAILDAAVRPLGAPPSDPAAASRARFVSLCGDRPREPFGRVVYRFGRPGRIELEQTASPSRRFRLWTRSTSPHSAENIIGFSVGAVRYDVGIATVMASGVIVRAFAGRRQVAELVSGTEEGVDFRLGPAAVDFDRPASPVFELGYPLELDAPPRSTMTPAP